MATVQTYPGVKAASGECSGLSVRVACINLFAIVFLQKFAITIGGSEAQLTQVSLLMPVFAVSLGYLVVSTRALLDVAQFVLFAAFISVAILGQILGGGSLSVPSFVYMFAIYFPYVFRITIEADDHLLIFSRFQKLMGIIAVLVFAQYGVQLAGGRSPGLDMLLPDWALFQAHTYRQPLYWGEWPNWDTRFEKPNGIFLPETSFVSQFLAVAIVIEWMFFLRRRYLALFILAELATVSGTGLLLLAALAVPLAIRAAWSSGKSQRALLLGAMVALPVLSTLAVASGWSEMLFARLSEFSEEERSGHQRFIRPFTRVYDELRTEDTLTLLVTGTGAGSVETGEVNEVWSPFSKVVTEYGLLTWALFFLFFTVALFRWSLSRAMSWSFFLMYHFLSGAFLNPGVVYAAYLLAAGYWQRRALAMQSAAGGTAKLDTAQRSLRDLPLPSR